MKMTQVATVEQQDVRRVGRVKMTPVDSVVPLIQIYKQR